MPLIYKTKYVFPWYRNVYFCISIVWYQCVFPLYGNVFSHSFEVGWIADYQTSAVWPICLWKTSHNMNIDYQAFHFLQQNQVCGHAAPLAYNPCKNFPGVELVLDIENLSLDLIRPDDCTLNWTFAQGLDPPWWLHEEGEMIVGQSAHAASCCRSCCSVPPGPTSASVPFFAYFPWPWNQNSNNLPNQNNKT